MRKLAKAAVAAGWVITQTNGNHFKWQSPTGAIVFSALTPSDHRAAKNVKGYLKRAGLCIQ